MSDKTLTISPFAGLWLTAFVLVKVGGSLLASWSWWWLLMPIVPVVWAVLTKMGIVL